MSLQMSEEVVMQVGPRNKGQGVREETHCRLV